MDVNEETSTSQKASSKESGLAREVMSFKHGHPVEKILVHPSGTQVISAGGPVIRVWDILSDAGCLHAMSNHQKTVTCLEWGDGRPYGGNSKKNLLSAGLDGLIKSYDIEDNYRVSKTMRVGAGVLSLAMSPEENTMLIGSANGEIAIRKRILSATEQASKNALLEGGSAEIALAAESFNKVKAAQQGGVSESLELADQQITSTSNVIRNNNHEIVVKPYKQKSAKLKKWDKLLKTFQYGDALDSVIDDKSIHPGYAFAIFSELMHRDGLHQALNSRDEISLLPILSFLLKYIADYRYASVACDVTAVLIDIYTPALGQSAAIDTLFQRLRLKVQREVEFQRNLVEVKGQLQMIMASQATA
jgi:U3 small nucleolar RNA-associated protein 15